MTKSFDCFNCGTVVDLDVPTHLLQERATVCQCGQVHKVRTVMSLNIVDQMRQIVDWTIVEVCVVVGSGMIGATLSSSSSVIPCQ